LLRDVPENSPKVVTGNGCLKIKNYIQDSNIKPGPIHKIKTIKRALIRPQT
jgi:hypothetical protein